jgi:hypothetical protein
MQHVIILYPSSIFFHIANHCRVTGGDLDSLAGFSRASFSVFEARVVVGRSADDDLGSIARVISGAVAGTNFVEIVSNHATFPLFNRKFLSLQNCYYT